MLLRLGFDGAKVNFCGKNKFFTQMKSGIKSGINLWNDRVPI